MKFRCKKDLYWSQTPGYSGWLVDNKNFSGGKNIKLVFKKGKEYIVAPRVYTRSNRSLQYLDIIGTGEDDKEYILCHDELHAGVANRFLEKFKIIV